MSCKYYHFLIFKKSTLNAKEELLGSTLSSADESSNDKADGCGSSQMTRARYFKSFDAHVFNLIFKRMLVESERLSHDPKMGTFTVTGSSELKTTCS